jgi:hypothetical protein
LPSAAMVSARCWSVQIHKMFGGCGTRFDTLASPCLASLA